jgi:hypothetical protein
MKKTLLSLCPPDCPVQPPGLGLWSPKCWDWFGLSLWVTSLSLPGPLFHLLWRGGLAPGVPFSCTLSVLHSVYQRAGHQLEAEVCLLLSCHLFCQEQAPSLASASYRESPGRAICVEPLTPMCPFPLMQEWSHFKSPFKKWPVAIKALADRNQWAHPRPSKEAAALLSTVW